MYHFKIITDFSSVPNLGVKVEEFLTTLQSENQQDKGAGHIWDVRVDIHPFEKLGIGLAAITYEVD